MCECCVNDVRTHLSAILQAMTFIDPSINKDFIIIIIIKNVINVQND